MSIDYSYFYKTKFSTDRIHELPEYDHFISAYSEDDRTIVPFVSVKAEKKVMLFFPECHVEQVEDVAGFSVFNYESTDESDYILKLWDYLGHPEPSLKICIDATAFLPHYLLFLIKWLKESGFKKFDILYTEPSYYVDREFTRFSDEVVVNVRQVIGYEGSHSPESKDDLMIISSGYDHKLIANVAEHKGSALKVQMFGFPPLKGDMYQESILRAYQAEESIGNKSHDRDTSILAPANDPFVTANILSGYVKKFSSRHAISNLYLSPLSTKPQTIGMALFYLCELDGGECSIIYPFCSHYDSNVSVGISDIWLYTIQFN